MSCTFKNPHNHAKGEVMIHNLRGVVPSSANRTVRPGVPTHPSPRNSPLDSSLTRLSTAAVRTMIRAIDYVIKPQPTMPVPLEDHAGHAFIWRNPCWHSGMLLRTGDSWRKKTAGDLFSLFGTAPTAHAVTRPKRPIEHLKNSHFRIHRQFGGYRHQRLQHQITNLFETAIKDSVQRKQFQELKQTPLRESLIEGFEEAWEKESMLGYKVQPNFSHPAMSYFKLLSLYIGFTLNDMPEHAAPLKRTMDLWFSGNECIGVTEQGHIVVYVVD